MTLYQRRSNIHYLVPLVLIVMILMRLVWMQLRTYDLVMDDDAMLTIFALTESYPEACAQSNASDHKQAKVIREVPVNVPLSKTSSWFVSLGLAAYAYLWGCSEGTLELERLLRSNQWIFVAVVAVATLMVRIVTASWVVSLVASVVLLSRGRMISGISEINTNLILSLIVTVWFMWCTHFFRSGSRGSLIAAMATAVIGSFFEAGLVFLTCSVPLLLVLGYFFRRYFSEPILLRFQAEKERISAMVRRGKLRSYEGSVILGAISLVVRKILGEEEPQPRSYRKSPVDLSSGSLLGTMSVPFALWAFQFRRWWRISLAWFAVGALAIIVAGGSKLATLAVFDELFVGSYDVREAIVQINGFGAQWLKLFSLRIGSFIDLHVGVSFAVIIFCAFQSPAKGLISFWESSWLLIATFVTVCLGSACFELVDLALLNSLIQKEFDILSRTSAVALACEPTILALGVAGGYHLIKVWLKALNPE